MKPQWLDDFKLDDAEGPAKPLGTTDAHALASTVVERAFSGAGAVSKLRRAQTFIVLAGVAGALAMVGTFYASGTEGPCSGAGCSDGKTVTVASPANEPPAAAPAERAAPAAKAPSAPTPTENVSVAALPNAIAPTASPQAKASDVASAPKSPADLLAAANRARRDHEWTRAASLYETVMSSRADESYAATVALASLRLEHFGDPRGALALYERALAARPGGALSVQAESGAARCRHALANE